MWDVLFWDIRCKEGKNICNEYGLLRIVIVISVFEMGIDIIGINNVILYGVLK